MSFLRRLSQQNYPYAPLVFVIMFAVYIRTLMPGTVGGDAGELQYAGPLLAHISNHIMSEGKAVKHLVYDVTSQPPRRMEWE